MNYFFRVAVLFSIGFVALGCGPASSSSTSKVAVIDINETLRDSGYGKKIDAILKEEERKISQFINQRLVPYQETVNKKIKEYGAKPTKEQRSEIDAMRYRFAQMRGQANTQARNELFEMQRELVNQFRVKAVLPNIKDLAKEKGYDVVLSKSPIILTFNGEINITEDLIDVINALEPIELKLPQAGQQQPAPQGNGKNGETINNPFLDGGKGKKPVDKPKPTQPTKTQPTKEDPKKETPKPAVKPKTETGKTTDTKATPKPTAKPEEQPKTTAPKPTEKPAVPKKETKATDSKTTEAKPKDAKKTEK